MPCTGRARESWGRCWSDRIRSAATPTTQSIMKSRPTGIESTNGRVDSWYRRVRQWSAKWAYALIQSGSTLIITLWVRLPRAVFMTPLRPVSCSDRQTGRGPAVGIGGWRCIRRCTGLSPEP